MAEGSHDAFPYIRPLTCSPPRGPLNDCKWGLECAVVTMQRARHFMRPDGLSHWDRAPVASYGALPCAAPTSCRVEGASSGADGSGSVRRRVHCRYGEFYHRVVNLTAVLVAKWQALGFTHGVLNTDNLSILGLTIDFGPFGFVGVGPTCRGPPLFPCAGPAISSQPRVPPPPTHTLNGLPAAVDPVSPGQSRGCDLVYIPLPLAHCTNRETDLMAKCRDMLRTADG